MKNEETVTQTKTETYEKPGFFKRLVEKVDTAMKAKADEKSQKSGNCCGSKEGGDKGDKCC